MENLESHEISGISLPVTETRGKLKSLVTADVKARTEKHRDKLLNSMIGILVNTRVCVCWTELGKKNPLKQE